MKANVKFFQKLPRVGLTLVYVYALYHYNSKLLIINIIKVDLQIVRYSIY